MRAGRPRIHGEAAGHYGGSPEYNAWRAAKGRCTNPRDKNYPQYGARGVTLAPEWANDFPAFLADVGRRPSSLDTLDRIGTFGGYVPGNVRWANRRTTGGTTWRPG